MPLRTTLVPHVPFDCHRCVARSTNLLIVPIDFAGSGERFRFGNSNHLLRLLAKPFEIMFDTLHATALSAIFLMATVPPSAADDTKPAQTALIPLEVLFCNPSRAQARIAPDGAYLSWLAPSDDGVLNVWVQPSDRSKAPHQITNDKASGIRIHGWSQDGEYVLYLQDKDGDENWRLYAVDLEKGETRDLTPFEGVRAQNLITDPERPREVLVGLNKRDPSIFDMYRVDLVTGELSLDTKNPGDVVSWITDADFRIRAAEAAGPANGDRIIRVRDGNDSPWRELLRFPFGENGGA